MSHHHDDCNEETVESLLKKLIILACDSVELGEKQVEQNRIQILQNRHIVKLLSVIAAEDAPPYLATIQLLSKGIPMPNPGPITLVAAGETDQTVIVGTGSDGQPWTGPIPTATYTDDNPAAATTDANGLETAVANGTNNVVASLVTAEGISLTSAPLQYIVNIPVPVVTLASISLQSNHA